MSMSTAAQALEVDGFAVVPGVLDAESVAQLRKVCEDELGGEEKELSASRFVQIPELVGIPLGETVVDVLRQIYGGPYVLYPNFTVREDVYVGWHVDTAFAGAHQHVWNDSFMHVQCAVYLQDNSSEEGGGLDVRPRSHRSLLPGLRGDHPLDRAARRLLGPRLRGEQLLTARAGDLVMWHARTEHRSTRPRVEADRTKYGVFFSTARWDPYISHRYLCHLVGQSVQRDGGETRRFPRYEEIVDLRFPDSFPEDFVGRIDRFGLRMATF
jgi:ectoine hydroxylase-related dioxygenase (phytanoyl-CoA dioxygenase family)